jgi:uncharacterized protein YciI
VKYVLFYEPASDFLERVPTHYSEHVAHWASFRDAGTLSMIGPFTDPAQGAMAVFTTSEAAESFVAGDPFVLHGIVADWRIQEWNEVLFAAEQ